MKQLLVPLSLSMVIVNGFTQETTEGEGPSSSELAKIVVTATRTERALIDVPATIDLIDEEDIEKRIARDIRDLIRYEPGISVAGTGSRFGLSGYTIRGIGGDRVQTLVDGVRIADEFSFGPFLSAQRDYVDVDALQAVEIARGPVSALYGSDAIGGVVAYRTKDPEDYLGAGDFYAGFKTGYSSVDESTVGTVTLAGGSGDLSALLLYTDRQASETENAGGIGGTGPNRLLPDPQDIDSDNLLLKLAYQYGDAHRFEFTADMLDTSTQTNLLSDYNTPISPTTFLKTRDSDDESERERISLEYTFTGDLGFADRLKVLAYTQDSEQFQITNENRDSLSSGLSINRFRASQFEQDINGINAQADLAFEAGNSNHYIVYGLDYWTTDSVGLRNGGSSDAVTGTPIPESFPFPTRDFPPTEIDQFALYFQDEITLLDGRLTVIPSLRYDSYDATATGDEIFFSGNPGQPEPADYDDSEISPKLGVVYRFNDALTGYAQYAQGFRVPPYDDVNVGFSNFIGGYKTISNPDLESEESQGLELGLRAQGNIGQVSVAAYYNKYDNFIASFLPAAQFADTFGIDPADGLLTFQSRNLDEVEIKGLEVSGELYLGALIDGAEQWSLSFAAAYSDGEDNSTGEPLNSVDPTRAVFGLGYSAPSGRWGGDLIWTLVGSKDQSDIDSTTNRLATAGYGVVDLLGYYYFTEKVRLNFGLFNIGDKSYIDWIDTASIGFDSADGTFPEAGRFTRPGFNSGVTLKVEL